jgi:hypothetical protein
VNDTDTWAVEKRVTMLTTVIYWFVYLPNIALCGECGFMLTRRFTVQQLHSSDCCYGSCLYLKAGLLARSQRESGRSCGRSAGSRWSVITGRQNSAPRPLRDVKFILPCEDGSELSLTALPTRYLDSPFTRFSELRQTFSVFQSRLCLQSW